MKRQGAALRAEPSRALPQLSFHQLVLGHHRLQGVLFPRQLRKEIREAFSQIRPALRGARHTCHGGLAHGCAMQTRRASEHTSAGLWPQDVMARILNCANISLAYSTFTQAALI